MIDAYTVYTIFFPLKLHFTSKGYDYYKYHGSCKALKSKIDFSKMPQRFFYHKVGTKFDDEFELTLALVAHFVDNPKFWITQFDYEKYMTLKGRMVNMYQNFVADVDKIICVGQDLKSSLLCSAGKKPTVMTMLLQEEIKLETFILLNRLIPFWGRVGEEITSRFEYDDLNYKITKYEPFVLVYISDMTRYKKFLLSIIQNADKAE